MTMTEASPRRHRRTKIAAFLTVVVVVLTGVGAAVAMTLSSPAKKQARLPGQHGYGLFEDLEYLTGKKLTARLNAFKKTGVQYARFQMEWSNVQNVNSKSYYWAPYDALIKGLVKRHIQPIAVLTDTPRWAAKPVCLTNPVCAPKNPQQFATFAAAAAKRYKTKVYDWEIWNEENISTFWAPDPNAGAYDALLAAAYSAIHHVQRKATVISGGLAPAGLHDEPGTKTISRDPPVDFLQRMYTAAHGHLHYDAMGYHPYAFPDLPGAQKDDDGWYEMYGSKPSIRSLMVKYGDGHKQIWGTEFGADTDPASPVGVTPKFQAQTITKGAKLWQSYPYTGPLIVYEYQDAGTDKKQPEDFFGLRTHSGKAKPAYAVFKRIAKAFHH